MQVTNFTPWFYVTKVTFSSYNELLEIPSVLSIAVLSYWFWVLWWVSLNRFWVCASGVNSKWTCCCAFAVQTSVDLKSSSCVAKVLLVIFSTWVSLVLSFPSVNICMQCCNWSGYCYLFWSMMCFPWSHSTKLVNNYQCTLKYITDLMSSCCVISVYHLRPFYDVKRCFDWNLYPDLYAGQSKWNYFKQSPLVSRHGQTSDRWSTIKGSEMSEKKQKADSTVINHS